MELAVLVRTVWCVLLVIHRQRDIYAYSEGLSVSSLNFYTKKVEISDFKAEPGAKANFDGV